MIVTFVYDTFKGIRKKTNQEEDFYVVRLGLVENGKVIRKSEPLIWLTKEQYDILVSSTRLTK